MVRKFLSIVVVALGLAVTGSTVNGADSYALDPYHSSITFMIQHLGISYIHGRFNNMSGEFTIDKDNPGKSSFALTLKTDSVDTAIPKRDDHLRSPDFFNAKQFPLITFKSTDVKAVKDGYEVTGDFDMHGVKKSISFTLQGGKTMEMKGTQKTGFYGNFPIQRNDFGVGAPNNMLGDTVYIYVGMEGAKK